MNSKASPQRRTVSYRGYELILEDADRLAAGGYVTLGNWSFAQILDHLARAFEASIDGVGTLLPWPVRLVGGFFLKGRMLNKTLPAGFKFPDGKNSRFAPDESIDVAEALQKLRHACHRCSTEKQRSLHPLFGRLETAEWDRFNLRHAELHMSFVVPTDAPSNADAPSQESHPVSTHA